MGYKNPEHTNDERSVAVARIIQENKLTAASARMINREVGWILGDRKTYPTRTAGVRTRNVKLTTSELDAAIERAGVV